MKNLQSRIRVLVGVCVIGGVMLVGCDDPKGKCQALSCLPDTSGVMQEVTGAYNDTMQGGTIDANGSDLEKAAADAIEWGMGSVGE